MDFIDNTFGTAFICLDSIDKNLEGISLEKKIKVAEILLKNISEKKKMWEQEKKYRIEIYKDFIKS